MSVASRNPFALLDEAGSRPASPPPKASAPPPPAPQRGTAQKTRGPASRGGKYYARGGSRSTQSRDTPADDTPESGPRKFDGERGRGRGRGGRGGPRGGRRQFDRHSATGKTDSDKKLHQGWGGDDGTRELQDETTANVDAAVEAASPAADAWGSADATASADAWGSSDAPADGATPAGDAKPEGRPRREEEEDNTLTLEQYQAQRKELASVPKLETRKANEGADGNIWKDVVPLDKSVEDNYFVGKSKNTPKTRAKKEEKVFIEIDAHFDRPSRGGGRGRGGDRDRGGRGRGRGRGGSSNSRTNGTNASNVNVDDETAFPSLS
ncbi:hypothetical protein K435DRAFT_147522 [Dendrothele bispora CBS 962.96]|uniref:Hyaluronan/mRNA-binding protein domain-containing protein n=1 Tax=Dendrothele bispora (strain CBS 962.96) TaxID=1314807 RepID=A0A4S8MPH1_DENBC|nr:hypothetical protein K435DRAFT_147522 [Dendrothele bispora CBS 962.96]